MVILELQTLEESIKLIEAEISSLDYDDNLKADELFNELCSLKTDLAVLKDVEGV